MKLKQKKSDKAITLIALVVTIVVLLILAGVSISMLTGENGIMKQAAESKDKTKIGDEKERVELAAIAAKAKTGWEEITEENLEKELTINIGERNVDYTLEQCGDKFIVTYPATGNSYLVDAGGKTTERGPWYSVTGTDMNGDKTLKVTNGEITLEVGDIIDYNPLIEGEEVKTVTSYSKENEYEDQTFSSDYRGTWKVLGVSDEGQILIAPTDVIKTTLDEYYYIKGREGYINAVSELDKISEIFGHGYGATDARSIRIEDINKVTGYNPNNVGVYDPNQTGNGKKYGEGDVGEYGSEVTCYWKGDAYPHYTTSNGLEGNSYDDHNKYYNKMFNWFDVISKTWKVSQKVTMDPVVTDINSMQKITTLKITFYYYYLNSLSSNSSTGGGLTEGSKAYKAIDNGSEQYYWVGSTFVGFDRKFCLFWITQCM